MREVEGGRYAASVKANIAAGTHTPGPVQSYRFGQRDICLQEESQHPQTLQRLGALAPGCVDQIANAELAGELLGHRLALSHALHHQPCTFDMTMAWGEACDSLASVGGQPRQGIQIDQSEGEDGNRPELRLRGIVPMLKSRTAAVAYLHDLADQLANRRAPVLCGVRQLCAGNDRQCPAAGQHTRCSGASKDREPRVQIRFQRLSEHVLLFLPVIRCVLLVPLHQENAHQALQPLPQALGHLQHGAAQVSGRGATVSWVLCTVEGREGEGLAHRHSHAC